MRAALLSLTLLGAAVAAGWAAAATPTKASWARQANAICRVELTRVHALRQPGQGDIAGLVTYLDRAIAIANPYTARIARLPRPASERPSIAQWVGIQYLAVREIRQLQAALKVRDMNKTASLLATLTRQGNRSDALARRLGAGVCAQS